MDYVSGSVVTAEGIVEGYVAMDRGFIVEVSQGKCPGAPFYTGLIMKPPINAHTHCGDAGLKVKDGMSFEELVAPPNGLKHRYLRETSEDAIRDSMMDYYNISVKNGMGGFIDFREGGAEGCRLLRGIPGAVTLGRPTSDEYNYNEVEDILCVSDGLGISSISDLDPKYLESLADHVRASGKIFAIHASERIREDIDTILSLDPRFIVHMVKATDSDLLKCADSEVPIVICPRSNRYFGSNAPISRMIEIGVDLALGTDNAMLCTPDLRAEAKATGEIAYPDWDDGNLLLNLIATGGSSIVKPHSDRFLKEGAPAELTVFPFKGELSSKNVLNSSEPILRCGWKNDLQKHIDRH